MFLVFFLPFFFFFFFRGEKNVRGEKMDKHMFIELNLKKLNICSGE